MSNHLHYVKTYGPDIAHLLLVLFFWPLGSSGHFLFYAVSYCLSKTQQAPTFWSFVNFFALAAALNFYDARENQRLLFFWRDVLLIAFLHYTYWKKDQQQQEQLSVCNASSSDRVLLYTFHCCVILGVYVTGIKNQVYCMSMLTIDMVLYTIENVLRMKHGEKLTSALYYVGAFVKAAYFYQHSHKIGGLQWLVLFQLDMMSRFESTPSTNKSMACLHAVTFKMLATTYAMSCFFM